MIQKLLGAIIIVSTLYLVVLIPLAKKNGGEYADIASDWEPIFWGMGIGVPLVIGLALAVIQGLKKDAEIHDD